MSEPRSLAVSEERALGSLVRELYPDLSWSRVRELVRTGRVTADGTVKFDPGARMPAGTTISVTPTGRRVSERDLPTPTIVHLDHHVVVVQKPAGLPSVPYEDGEHRTLLHATKAAIARLDRPRTHQAPLGIVQRLDIDTTGLLVFARTRESRKHLQQQFRAHTIEREYVAIAHGQVREQSHESWIVEDRGDGLRGGHRGSTRAPAHARFARTHVTTEEPLGGATLCRCRLETGRQHQIRIHLSESGHPLVGERVYIRDFRGTPLEAPRVMLHAGRLGFLHPADDRPVSWEDPIPEDFQSVLERLRIPDPNRGQP